MIIKNLKIFFSLILQEKLSNFMTFLLTTLISVLNNILLYLCLYEFFYFIRNSHFSEVKTLLFSIIITRIFVGCLIFVNNETNFSKEFLNNLKKFCIKISQDNALLENNQNNPRALLKFQFEIKMISRDIYSKHFNKIQNISLLGVNFLSILVLFFSNPSQKNLLCILASVIFVLFMFATNRYQTLIENKLSNSIDKNLIVVNQDIFHQISSFKSKILTENQLLIVEKKLQSTIDLFSKKSWKFIKFRVFEFALKIFYPLTMIYFQHNLRMLDLFTQNPSVVISFLLYNTLCSFSIVKLLKDFTNDDNAIKIYNYTDTQKINQNTTINTNFNCVNNLEFRNVSLQSGNDLLKNLNFTIKTGENLSFISDNQNIVLLRKLFERTTEKISGELLINNVNLETYNDLIIKKMFIIASKNVVTTQDSIKNNITQLNEKISDSCILKASKLSGFYNYILSLPLGYQTKIENSSLLTDIEKFELSITRALISDGCILIVDFIGLNERDERIHSIKNMLLSNINDKILLILTNDVYQIENFKKIAIIEKDITTIGTHRTLIQSNEFYSNFYIKNKRECMFSE